MDLPYTFAAGDQKMTREKNFNMEIITKAVRPMTAVERRQQYYAAKKKRKEERAARRAERAKAAQQQEPSQEELDKRQKEAKQELEKSVGPGVIVVDGNMTVQDIEKLKADMQKKLELETREKLRLSGHTNVNITSTTEYAFVPC